MSDKQEKKKAYVVDHPRFYLMVDGKSKLVPIGTRVEMTESSAKKAGNKVVLESEYKTISSGKTVSSSEVEALKAKLDAAEKALAAATKSSK